MNVVVAKGDVISAYGLGIDALWNGLMSGKTAIKPTDMFADRGFVSNQAALIPDLQIEPGESRVMAMLRPLLSPLIGKFDPQTPLILATTVGEIEYLERAVIQKDKRLWPNSRLKVLLRRIKEMLGLNGPASVVSSACASSSAAISVAAAMVRSGCAPAMLLIAVDSISEFVYSGFSTLNSLCETPARPFDAQRCGLSLGEAAAWVLVTPENHAAASDPLMTILGWGSATDAVHMTAPDRNAGGLITAVRLACEMAGCTPSDLNLVAAHGTATPYNDSMEMLALRKTIAKPIPTFSIKGGVGHTLGSAGLLQVLVAARAMKEGRVPPTIGLSNPSPDSDGWVSNSTTTLSDNPIALSMSSGFGGVNTAVVFSHIAEPNKQSSNIAAVPRAGIQAVAWRFDGKWGSNGINGLRLEGDLPLTQEEMVQFIGRPLKYFSRMTYDAKISLAAANMAMRACNYRGFSSKRIGVLAGDFVPTWAADWVYFRDYIDNGRSMARANLFIYTLPTSALDEVAIALGLTGPTLFMETTTNPLHSLILLAKQMVDYGEADVILVFWRKGYEAICFAIGRCGETIEIPEVEDDLNLKQFVVRLGKMESFK